MSELGNIVALATSDNGPRSYLYYGPGGTGKTTIATKHPGKRKLFLDIDRKLKEQSNIALDDLKTISIWEPDELPSPIALAVQDPTRTNPKEGFDYNRKPPTTIDRMIKLINELGQTLRKDFPFDMICLDSGTRVADHLLDLLLYKHKMGSMTQTLWGIYGGWYREILESFLSLPCDRIFIAHDAHVTKRNKQGEVVEEYIRPSIYGATGVNLVQRFSEAYYFLGTADQGKTYRIQTKADKLLPARTTKALEFRETIDPKKIYV